MSPLAKNPASVVASDRSRLEAQALKRLHVSIGVVAAIVMVELWTLTAALEAWTEGHMDTLPWLLAFQVAAFGGAIATWIVTSRERVVHHAVAPIGTRQPATAD